MDGGELRETLWNFGLGSGLKTAGLTLGPNILRAMQPGGGLNVSLAYAENASTKANMLLSRVSENARAQRAGPAYTRWGGTIDVVNRVANAHRHANGFKPRTAGRF